MRVGVSECVWGFSALPVVLLKDSVYCMDDCGFPELDVCCTGHDICRYRHIYVDGDIYLAQLCLPERPGLRDIGRLEIRRLNHRRTICWHTDVTDSRPIAVC